MPQGLNFINFNLVLEQLAQRAAVHECAYSTVIRLTIQFGEEKKQQHF
jgi:hypothetical protein